ncbi:MULTISPECIES: DMT family transporter [unclassified Gordonia (in: high G+C Gram-positive bacteria)]|uniref:DMT family transporter n=1 Tax=unclassified Gordonia (in: high G+C Gram-positive bacteria) TaxID=2657482 RepID=UPI001FFEECE3|nr:DMT family transporter [Gordonia sp. PP30]UQE74519.1 DMT family transporter [Gordonia sp. PP30]
MHSWVPALLAVLAAAMIATGTVLRQRASARNGSITKGWWLGAVVAIVGFGFQAWALGLGSILLVQPLVVLAVLFALPLEARVDHRKPSRMDWVWGGVLVAAVVLFLVIARPHPSDRRAAPTLLAVTVTVLVMVLIALVILAERCHNAHHRALCYGITAGALFGVAALLIKSVALHVIASPTEVFRHPDLYLLVVVAALAVVAQQRAFGAGDIQTSFPAMNVMEPAVSMALGVILLGENLKVGIGTVTLLILILLVAAVAVVKLAQHAAIRGDAGSHDDRSRRGVGVTAESAAES